MIIILQSRVTHDYFAVTLSGLPIGSAPRKAVCSGYQRTRAGPLATAFAINRSSAEIQSVSFEGSP